VRERGVFRVAGMAATEFGTSAGPISTESAQEMQKSVASRQSSGTAFARAGWVIGGSGVCF
jgi:hypothetical protein